MTISVYILDNMIVLKAYSQCNFPEQVRKSILLYTITRTPSFYVDKQQDYQEESEPQKNYSKQ